MRSTDRAAPPIDAALLERCRRGDTAALSQVFSAHAGSLGRLLRRILGPHADADDALQQTFVAAIHAFPRFRGEAAIGTWLGRIAINQAYELLRKPEVKRRAKLSAVDTRIDEATPDRVHEARRQLAQLHQHLGRISPKQRIAFVLHVIEGHSIDEVTALMGTSSAATKSRIMWARRTLVSRALRDPLLSQLVKGDVR